MQIIPYLDFDGHCEEAFKLYERCLGGRIGDLFRYAGSPMAGDVAADWGDKIMHGHITIGDLRLMGADSPGGRPSLPSGFSLSIQLADPNEAERIFRELSEGGSIRMPLEKTFWAERFGMLTDRFGIPWLINCEAAGQNPEN
jgi:PhnB protein